MSYDNFYDLSEVLYALKYYFNFLMLEANRFGWFETVQDILPLKHPEM